MEEHFEDLIYDIRDFWRERTPQPIMPENAVPFRNQGPKPERNAPCPCGSGKKYKKCCGKE
jgi:uncharacterized protein YecA (UPF0149 family)